MKCCCEIAARPDGLFLRKEKQPEGKVKKKQQNSIEFLVKRHFAWEKKSFGNSSAGDTKANALVGTAQVLRATGKKSPRFQESVPAKITVVCHKRKCKFSTVNADNSTELSALLLYGPP